MRDFEIWDATPPEEEAAECGICHEMKMDVEAENDVNVCEDCYVDLGPGRAGCVVKLGNDDGEGQND